MDLQISWGFFEILEWLFILFEWLATTYWPDYAFHWSFSEQFSSHWNWIQSVWVSNAVNQILAKLLLLQWWWRCGNFNNFSSLNLCFISWNWIMMHYSMNRQLTDWLVTTINSTTQLGVKKIGIGSVRCNWKQRIRFN